MPVPEVQLASQGAVYLRILDDAPAAEQPAQPPLQLPRAPSQVMQSGALLLRLSDYLPVTQAADLAALNRASAAEFRADPVFSGLQGTYRQHVAPLRSRVPDHYATAAKGVLAITAVAGTGAACGAAASHGPGAASMAAGAGILGCGVVSSAVVVVKYHIERWTTGTSSHAEAQRQARETMDTAISKAQRQRRPLQADPGRQPLQPS